MEVETKPNKIQQIEEELNCRIVDKNEFEEFKKWKDEQNRKDQKESTENDFWTSDINVNNIGRGENADKADDILKKQELNDSTVNGASKIDLSNGAIFSTS